MPDDDEVSEFLGSISLTGGTDNLGNDHLLVYLLTSKQPLEVVRTELAVQLGKRTGVLKANGPPRLLHGEEAAFRWGSACPFSYGFVVPAREASCLLRRRALELG